MLRPNRLKKRLIFIFRIIKMHFYFKERPTGKIQWADQIWFFRCYRIFVKFLSMEDASWTDSMTLNSGHSNPTCKTRPEGVNRVKKFNCIVHRVCDAEYYFKGVRSYRRKLIVIIGLKPLSPLIPFRSHFLRLIFGLLSPMQFRRCKGFFRLLHLMRKTAKNHGMDARAASSSICFCLSFLSFSASSALLHFSISRRSFRKDLSSNGFIAFFRFLELR